MKIAFAQSFTKAFRKRNTLDPALESLFWSKVERFIRDPFDPVLKTHKLSGRLKDFWSFSLGYDSRVVFYFTDGKPKKAVFIDIGTHDEVY
jgi:mRNA-degrading endonuclease YafQ of YafQ-DinJ toxin-antitoxin module